MSFEYLIDDSDDADTLDDDGDTLDFDDEPCHDRMSQDYRSGEWSPADESIDDLDDDDDDDDEISETLMDDEGED